MLFVLILLAVVLVALAAWALIWAVRTGQFDDLDSQGWSVVLDDDRAPPGEQPAGDSQCRNPQPPS